MDIRNIAISSLSETGFVYGIFVLRYVILKFGSTKIDGIFKTEFIEKTKTTTIDITNSLYTNISDIIAKKVDINPLIPSKIVLFDKKKKRKRTRGNLQRKNISVSDKTMHTH